MGLSNFCDRILIFRQLPFAQMPSGVIPADGWWHDAALDRGASGHVTARHANVRIESIETRLTGVALDLSRFYCSYASELSSGWCRSYFDPDPVR
jgi:hypothetical protein